MVEKVQKKKNSQKDQKRVIIVDNTEESRPGFTAWKVTGNRFVLPSYYKILDPIGSGAYGIVVAAQNTLEQDPNNLVAIKKINKPFEHKIFAKRTLRELKIMRLLDHENILKIK